MKKNVHYTRHQEKRHNEDQSNKKKVHFFAKEYWEMEKLLTDKRRQCLKEAAENVLNETHNMTEWYPEQGRP